MKSAQQVRKPAAEKRWDKSGLDPRPQAKVKATKPTRNSEIAGSPDRDRINMGNIKRVAKVSKNALMGAAREGLAEGMASVQTLGPTKQSIAKAVSNRTGITRKSTQRTATAKADLGLQRARRARKQSGYAPGAKHQGM